MLKYRIFFDADEVLMKFIDKLLEKYNAKYNKNIREEDIQEWDLNASVEEGTDIYQFMDEPGFFAELEPYDDASKILLKLIDEGHQVYISTACWEEAVQDKYDSFKKHFPFMQFNQIIIINDKFLLNGDFMLDDRDKNIEQSSVRYPVIMDKPWNRHVDALRVSSLQEFYELIQTIKAKEEKEATEIADSLYKSIQGNNKGGSNT